MESNVKMALGRLSKTLANLDSKFSNLENRMHTHVRYTPIFDGDLDPRIYLKWEADIDRYCDWYKLDDDEKINFAKSRLALRAKSYVQTLDERDRRYGAKLIRSWEEFKTVMRKKYVPPSYHQPQPDHRTHSDLTQLTHLTSSRSRLPSSTSFRSPPYYPTSIPLRDTSATLPATPYRIPPPRPSPPPTPHVASVIPVTLVPPTTAPIRPVDLSTLSPPPTQPLVKDVKKNIIVDKSLEDCIDIKSEIQRMDIEAPILKHNLNRYSFYALQSIKVSFDILSNFLMIPNDTSCFTISHMGYKSNHVNMLFEEDLNERHENIQDIVQINIDRDLDLTSRFGSHAFQILWIHNQFALSTTEFCMTFTTGIPSLEVKVDLVRDLIGTPTQAYNLSPEFFCVPCVDFFDPFLSHLENLPKICHESYDRADLLSVLLFDPKIYDDPRVRNSLFSSIPTHEIIKKLRKNFL